MSEQKTYREFWIVKGTSNFCSQMVMNDDFTFVKSKPDGFYDIVQTSDTVDGSIHVVEIQALHEAEEKIDERQIESVKRSYKHIAREALSELKKLEEGLGK